MGTGGIHRSSHFCCEWQVLFSSTPSSPVQVQLPCQCQIGWWQPLPAGFMPKQSWWPHSQIKTSYLNEHLQNLSCYKLHAVVSRKFEREDLVACTHCSPSDTATTPTAFTPCFLTFWMWAIRLAQPFSTKSRFSWLPKCRGELLEAWKSRKTWGRQLEMAKHHERIVVCNLKIEYQKISTNWKYRFRMGLSLTCASVVPHGTLWRVSAQRQFWVPAKLRAV